MDDADPVNNTEDIARWGVVQQRARTEIRRNNSTNVYIPYQVDESHWLLLHIDTVHDTITVYDSQDSSAHKSAATKMVSLVNKWWNDTGDQDTLQMKWGTCVQQRNNYDCGLCLCLNMRRLMLKRRRPKQLTRTRTALEEWG